MAILASREVVVCDIMSIVTSRMSDDDDDDDEAVRGESFMGCLLFYCTDELTKTTSRMEQYGNLFYTSVPPMA